MKPLMATQKENKRYLLVKGKVENIEKSILDFIGVLGMSKACLSWIKKEKGSAIICINRESVNNIRASFSVWPEEIKVTKVSGTLKSLKIS